MVEPSQRDLDRLAAGQISRMILTLPDTAWRRSDPIGMDSIEHAEGERFLTRDPGTGDKIVLTRTYEKRRTTDGVPSWETFEARVNSFKISSERAKAKFGELKEVFWKKLSTREEAARSVLTSILNEDSDTLRARPWVYRMGRYSERFSTTIDNQKINLEVRRQRVKVGGEHHMNIHCSFFTKLSSSYGVRIVEILNDQPALQNLFELLVRNKIGWFGSLLRRIRGLS